MSFTTTDLTPRIGSEIHTEVEHLLDGSIAATLKDLLVKRGVLVFRNLNISDEQQLQFGKTIGQVRLEHGLTSTKIMADKTKSPIFADYTEGTYYFHIDGTYTDTPGFASILRPHCLAPEGGQTEFCNTYALYEDLSASDKKLLEQLEAVHSAETNMRLAFPNPTETQLKAWGEQTNPPKTHPVVWEHLTGRRSLILATTIKYFVGMTQKDSDALLKRLLDMAEQPEYRYRHDWQLGDLLIWDNTGTMHRVVPFDLDCGRELNRVVLLGEEKITGVNNSAT